MDFDRVRELFDYDPITGIVTRRKTTAPMWKFGQIVGCPDRHGYLLVRVDGVLHKLHRMIWLWMTGELPILDIDHVDRDGSNNSWENLREATKSQNLSNRTKQSNNTSGFKGVSWNKQNSKWAAKINVEGRQLHLGFRDTPVECYRLYVDAARKYVGEFARVS